MRRAIGNLGSVCFAGPLTGAILGTSLKYLTPSLLSVLVMSFGLDAAFGSSWFSGPRGAFEWHESADQPAAEKVFKANVFGEGKVDRRSEISREGSNQVLAGVIRIETLRSLPGFTEAEGFVDSGMSSTAFMVSPCLALTNYHAVFRGTRKPKKPEDYGVDVFLKLREGGEVKTTTATPVIWGSFSDTNVGNDWALLRLKVCLGKKTGWFEFKALDQERLGKKVFHLVGFPGDKTFDKLWASKNCTIYGQYSDFGGPLLHDCSMRSGASGAPIFEVDPDGVPMVAGINSCEFNKTKRVFEKFREEFANTAVPVEAFLPRIQSLIDADISAAQLANPARNKKDQKKSFSL